MPFPSRPRDGPRAQLVVGFVADDELRSRRCRRNDDARLLFGEELRSSILAWRELLFSRLVELREVPRADDRDR